ncbi:bifunctional tRNA (5-methylaminomethyl-2-thiouridine)(34)-methyltransferase MnmD/FAD-dependent 5-carboxymethylaminomethyl-2-thiouridine(34) oxidoreductase MnmC [Aeromonas salmonicida]|uniref:bifunctional tRNA (5-methylaminomethyl-2-thiouridine)(34)-methyltransferase MnmD/FAD-dependent 5-carboxymethylaminomethyl-2-thiouridine(34) oxidoreductase MnmC n=1 Tax=Aeromonas salmonicida TaxID=645 RepID=UPI00073D092C|nr:bifunctional tRNA (5-methylaminomethyl-2-thiouridine)(34)-methyltransferase MnmD/FAD-dependent 5-carboxymethylaminomethyl-2-thiouridine(34) oxidoreductase MnmC [Aeromonas salmonicida]KTA76415.1 FAD-dependent oxidoreductase [Aeromonas salmonicida]MDE7529711.1 bifunctional tRNA (5-methylaminomethyl-2-thiouridine)(34)-methyltransferase MnmD/FAD-dependent 5-carboxymethylaminomethyl-2-thiouridine(34) oxidoreductase MnmC [Aeromonas salmonicida]MDE7533976.1 bifunctional tRNA (5-methylaminomethyl-2-t
MTRAEGNVSQTSLHHARLDWNEAGTPVSSDFGDVYFSNDNGLSETRYVFLQQNGLPARFSHHNSDSFVIGETGFGTGLNFLATMKAFLEQAPQTGNGARLHFISFEKFPLTRDDLRKALAAWPELAPFSQALIAQWPLPVPGCHRLHFAGGRIRLDLWLGDIKDMLPQVPHGEQGLVDTWYLDGFAPAKNPEMWTQDLFDGLARLARPGATLSTFTSAGFVRRGLIAAGFAMKKVKGHGSKWAMLAGERVDKKPQRTIVPWYARPAGRDGEVVIIGGGIASAMTALSLVERGRKVTLLCEDHELATGASGNRQGALYPLLNGEHDALSRFYSLAFGYARQRLLSLAERHPIAFDLCGVVQLGYDDKSTAKLAKMQQGPFPHALMRPLTPAEAEHECGLPSGHAGVSYPLGGWLCPADLTRAAIKEALSSGLLQVEYDCPVTAIHEHVDGWLVTSREGRQWQAPNLVVAAGHQLPALLPFAELPLYPVRGQVSHVPTTATLSQLKTVLCYDGYLTPAHDAEHCIGASYGRNQSTQAFSAEEQAQNQARLQACLPDQAWPAEVDVSSNEARVGVRCASRDHLPVAGPVVRLAGLADHYAQLQRDQQNPAPLPLHPGLYVLGALGSRGLCSAPLCGELLASEICGDPLPLATDLLEALHPARYWIRKLLKGKPLN